MAEPDPDQQSTGQTIRVQVPDVGVVEFPQGTSEADMTAAIAQAHAAKNPPSNRPQRGWLDTALDVADALHAGGAVGIPDRKSINRLAQWLPTAEGTVLGGIGTAAGGPIVGAGAAALGGASGEGQRQLMRDATGAETTSDPAKAADQMRQAALTQGGAELVGSGLLAPVAGRAGEALMQSAIKPGIKLTSRALIRGTELPIVGTLLKEGVNITQGGIDKLTSIIQASNKTIRSALDALPASSSLDPDAIAARVDPLIESARAEGNPEANVKALEAVKEEFLRNHGQPSPASVMKTGSIPTTRGQDIKVATYKQIGDTPYQAVATGNIPAARIQGQQAIARGLKEDIASQAAANGTDITAANAREGAAITARNAVAQQVAKAGNRDPVALAWLAENPVAAGLYIMERSPAVKSLLANGLYKQAAAAGRVPVTVLQIIVHALAGTPQAVKNGPQ